jgi:hypothetical protein
MTSINDKRVESLLKIHWKTEAADISVGWTAEKPTIIKSSIHQ